MECYFPWSKVDGGYSKVMRCGQCHGCRQDYARQMSIRCLHESKLYERNCFITLTYKDLPLGSSLCYRDFQLFMKRLRARFRARIRFYMCGEYGTLNGRPHFHALLFNCDFSDRVYYRTTGSGAKLFTSKLLEELWPHGFASVGNVTLQSAGYVARYVMKKVLGDGLNTVNIIDPDTGEIYVRVKEFARMSLKPGIGADWLKKFFSDVYPEGKVLIDGQKCRAPKYYDKIYRAQGAGEYMKLVLRRAKEVEGRFGELLPNRIEAKSIVHSARLKQLRRS